jgi:hypothetical protein
MIEPCVRKIAEIVYDMNLLAATTGEGLVQKRS